MGRNLREGAKCSYTKRLIRFAGNGTATNALEETIRCHPADSDPSIKGREMPSRGILQSNIVRLPSDFIHGAKEGLRVL
jgi:hypothetical protein